MEQKLTVGRTVHFVLDFGHNKGQVRPAIVLAVWGETCANLAVLPDGSNDGVPTSTAPDGSNAVARISTFEPVWKTSVTYDETGERPGSWHWPPRA